MMDNFQIVPHVLALATAYALALPIGWDRERESRSAGLRTFPLVALASCGFIQATETLLIDAPEGTARVVEGVITGIGLLVVVPFSSSVPPCVARQLLPAYGLQAQSAQRSALAASMLL